MWELIINTYSYVLTIAHMFTHVDMCGNSYVGTHMWEPTRNAYSYVLTIARVTCGQMWELMLHANICGNSYVETHKKYIFICINTYSCVLTIAHMFTCVNI